MKGRQFGLTKQSLKGKWRQTRDEQLINGIEKIETELQVTEKAKAFKGM